MELILCSISEDIDGSKFDNLDSWVNAKYKPKYEKEILNKLIKDPKKEGEEKKSAGF